MKENYTARHVAQLYSPTEVMNQESCDLPSLTVLHVGVGAGLEKSLGYSCHAAHHLRRVFLRAERTDQVKRRFHSPHCGCINLS